MIPPVLEFCDVGVTYHGGVRALSQISLSLEPGERVALVGNNGSGKTTLLRAAVGLVPFTGKINICGRPLSSSTVAGLRREVGFLFSTPDDQILFPNVLDDVSFTLRGRGVGASEAVSSARAMLEELHAGHLVDRVPHELSQGERLRVALAGVLVGRPAVLLLDEPTASLDPPGKDLLAGILERTGAAVLIATHDLTFAQRISHRQMRMENGRIDANLIGTAS